MYRLILILLLFSSCVSDDSKEKSKKLNSISRLYETEFDGCQYIVYKGYKNGGITHKGNCTNHVW